MSAIVNFTDILKPRNTQFGIVKFMTRTWKPLKTLTLDKYYVPQELKKVVADSVYIDAFLEAESIRTGVRKEQLKKEVLDYLEEIAMDDKKHVMRWLGIVFLKICFMMKIGVFVNEPAVLKLKSMMGKNPVLFLPTHRSYADFCLMTYLCYHYDISLPAVAAGMDFYSMAVVGQTMRETGAFYIRRTLVGAPLYAATLRHYVRTLVAKHGAPVEFFLEGTRSRSNKSLPPKYGMLSMTLVPYFAREVTDITLVPINISYDRVVEQSLFAYEHLGVPKPKETTGGLLKSLHRLNDHFGNIYINLGDPISIKEYLDQSSDQSVDASARSETLKPLDLQQLTAKQVDMVQDIADYIVTLQQEITVVTITNLLAIVLMESLMKNEALTFDQVLKKVEWLIEVLQNLGASVFENDIKGSVERILVVHKNMITLDKDGKLRLVPSVPMDVNCDVQRKMKGHILRAETMVNAIPIIQLQLYVNPVLHCLIPPAVVYAVVRAREVSKDQLSADYHRLRKLLRHEFFHLEKTEDLKFDKALQYCIENKIVTDTGTFRPGSDQALQYLLQWTILPALTTLATCVDVMMQCKKCSHIQLLKLVQERVESARCHPYCLSLEAAANCVQGLATYGALTRHKEENEISYEIIPEEIEECRSLITSVLPKIVVDFGSSNSVISLNSIKAKL
ncbi:dihydroxyacetone phosphate acyltransferase isoform X1 [Maniola jurtina]|uniref:dihydroxyacetone phosphate acyltransferase isoform X1 n=1 Tax=Maniola jurtina TaxID=191418 RepID=UPI001E686736|nr:dihydroxyacetone phosphate acyltransferase isoform X1 [Maniola jurtina]XP_045776618.1 dihydroxyacetone phosphate acyltransferase isoform X1 [Maniola jurtina]